MIEHMAPPRPAEAHIISTNDGSEPLGVLVLRAQDVDAARVMAYNALTVDIGWEDQRAFLALVHSIVRQGRWYRVPDHNDDDMVRWLMIQAKPGVLKGSSPGWYFRFPEHQEQRSLPEIERAS